MSEMSATSAAGSMPVLRRMGLKRYTGWTLRSADAAVQCRAEVVPEVLDVLDADGEPDQPVGDGGGLGLPAAAALEARLDAAERGGVDPEARLAAEEVGGHLALGEHDADDRAEPGVAHLRQRGVLAEAAY